MPLMKQYTPCGKPQGVYMVVSFAKFYLYNSTSLCKCSKRAFAASSDSLNSLSALSGNEIGRAHV